MRSEAPVPTVGQVVAVVDAQLGSGLLRCLGPGCGGRLCQGWVGSGGLSMRGWGGGCGGAGGGGGGGGGCGGGSGWSGIWSGWAGGSGGSGRGGRCARGAGCRGCCCPIRCCGAGGTGWR